MVAFKSLGSEGTEKKKKEENSNTSTQTIQKFKKISQYSSTLKIWYIVDNVMAFYIKL